MRAPRHHTASDGARRTRRSTVALALAGILLVTACGGDDDGADGSGPPAGTDAVPDTEVPASDTGGSPDTTTAAEDDVGEPKMGGSITYGMYGEIAGFDPLVALDLPSHGGSAPVAIYDVLMRLDEDQNIVPKLAEGLETTDDGTTWVMTLRAGVTFHDGTPLDAAAVIFNVERHQDPDNASPALNEVSKITAMTAVDDLTVEFVLDEPWAAFPSIFTRRTGYIASPTAVEASGEEFTRNPVGAGPFTFVEWVPDDHFTLARNEDYWQDGLPYLDEIRYTPVPDTETRLTSTITGEIDVTYFITAREINTAADNDAVVVESAMGNGAETISMNMSEAPFDDLRIRQAIAMATNYDALAQVRFGGEHPRAYSIFAPESPFFSDHEDDAPVYDLDAATALVDEYEEETGTPVSFTHLAQNTPDRVVYAEALQAMWEQAGMDVELEFIDAAEFVTRLGAMEFQVVPRILPHFADPDPYVYLLLHCDSNQNRNSYCDPEVDAALDTGRTSLDESARADAYEVVNEHIITDLPFVMYGRTIQALVHSPRLHGVDHTLDMTLYPEALWVD